MSKGKTRQMLDDTIEADREQIVPPSVLTALRGIASDCDEIRDTIRTTMNRLVSVAVSVGTAIVIAAILAAIRLS